MTGTDRIRGQVRRSNLARYAGGSEVGAYIDGRYHRLRLQLALELLWESRPATVLELGSSAAAPLLASLPPGVRAIAVDIDPHVLPRRSELVSPVAADVADSLPFRDASVDSILICELIEHLYDSEGLLAECGRVLKPGGCLVVTTPNLAGLQDRLRFLSGLSPRQVDVLHPYLKLHIRPFTKHSLGKLLTSSGFTVSTVRSNFLTFRFGTRRIWIRWVAVLAPGLGGSLVVAARNTGTRDE